MKNYICKPTETIGYETKWVFTVRDANGKIKSQKTYHNIIPTIAREQLTKILSANVTALSETKIQFQELGTGVTPPSNADTGLETPSGATRKPISSTSYSANVLNVFAFWAAGEATGSWTEFATFIDGTIASNSGILFNHITISVTVAAPDTLTVDGTVTFT